MFTDAPRGPSVQLNPLPLKFILIPGASVTDLRKRISISNLLAIDAFNSSTDDATHRERWDARFVVPVVMQREYGGTFRVART